MGFYNSHYTHIYYAKNSNIYIFHKMLVKYCSYMHTICWHPCIYNDTSISIPYTKKSITHYHMCIKLLWLVYLFIYISLLYHNPSYASIHQGTPSLFESLWLLHSVLPTRMILTNDSKNFLLLYSACTLYVHHNTVSP